MKLSEEKVSKSTNSTMAALAAAHPPAPVDLPPVLPPRSDNGYGEFLARYQADMKHLDDQLAELTSRYQHRKHIAELVEETASLRHEKNETEQSLRKISFPC